MKHAFICTFIYQANSPQVFGQSVVNINSSVSNRSIHLFRALVLQHSQQEPSSSSSTAFLQLGWRYSHPTPFIPPISDRVVVSSRRRTQHSTQRAIEEELKTKRNKKELSYARFLRTRDKLEKEKK